MRKRSVLYAAFGLVLALWVLNYLALQLYFYWTLDWYDYLMHFLGGLTLGVMVIWVFNIDKRSLKHFLFAFICVMLIGAAWEVFEYVNGLTLSTEAYNIDTVHDLIMDALGATAAYYLATLSPRLS